MTKVNHANGDTHDLRWQLTTEFPFNFALREVRQVRTAAINDVEQTS